MTVNFEKYYTKLYFITIENSQIVVESKTHGREAM